MNWSSYSVSSTRFPSLIVCFTGRKVSYRCRRNHLFCQWVEMHHCFESEVKGLILSSEWTNTFLHQELLQTCTSCLEYHSCRRATLHDAFKLSAESFENPECTHLCKDWRTIDVLRKATSFFLHVSVFISADRIVFKSTLEAYFQDIYATIAFAFDDVTVLVKENCTISTSDRSFIISQSIQ